MGSALFVFFCRGKCNVHSQRSTSGACQPLGGQHIAGHFPTCMCRGGTWLGFKQAITQTKYKCTTIVPAIQLEWRNTIFYPYISSGLTLSVFTPITHMYSTVSYFCNIICSILKCIQHFYLVRTRVKTPFPGHNTTSDRIAANTL